MRGNIDLKKDDSMFYLFCACFALLLMCVLHVAQQKRINELQTQLDELKLVVDHKFLPALILDKEAFQIR